MSDQPRGGTVGIRSHKNIEIMQNRRMAGYDTYGIAQAYDDRDDLNNGLVTEGNYYM